MPRSVMSILSAAVLAVVPVTALLAFSPSALQPVDDSLLAESAVVETQSVVLLAEPGGEQLEEVTLENWDYTVLRRHRLRHILCRILQHSGHPLFARFCSPFTSG